MLRGETSEIIQTVRDPPFLDNLPLLYINSEEIDEVVDIYELIRNPVLWELRGL
jgi:hypothetical protein